MSHSLFSYAGLGEVMKPGLSVERATERLRRFAWVEERLLFIQAAHLTSVPEREFKSLLGHYLYQASGHADAFRQRLKEMRVPRPKIGSSPDEALTRLLDEALHARSSDELAAALVWLKRELRDAYVSYLAATNSLADTASVESIEVFVQHETRAVAALEAYVQARLQPSEAFVAHLRPYLSAAGGLDGTADRGPEWARDRSIQAYKIAHELRRDSTTARVWDYQAPPQAETGPHLAYMMGLRLSEINVAEGIAIVMFETPGRPWEFYRALARHLWDEVRHSMMGEAGIEATLGRKDAVPMRDYEGVYCMEAEALEQYATLGIEIEGGNMRYPVGKRGEWEFCRDQAKHPLMTLFQDYDWADEVVHVNIARQQLSTWFTGGGVKELSELAANGKINRTAIKRRHAPVALVVPGDIVERGRALAGAAKG